MDNSILFRTDASILCLLLFFGMLAMVTIGQFIRKKALVADEGETRGGVNSLLGALFGLWGFILAFTFGQSGTRFENVRGLIVDEANNIRTAILKADLYPDSIRDQYRADLKTYLEARIDYYDYVTDERLFMQAKQQISATAKKLWARTAALAKRPEFFMANNNMMAALTSIFDSGTKRESVLKARVPDLVVYMLFALALAISFVGGFTTPVIKHKEWILIGVFAMLACLIVYITLDLGRPMRGLIRPDMGEDAMIQLRSLFK